ncbi:hypothetical protein VTK73DRAFT_9864 [Phialemonium thermophilum]|uniref:Sorting nexin MVP1 n=1 Tax=Phialemonium thermophilum TaxID=223376 RepID=A0ABR3XJE2_9PEZI
MSLFSDSEGGDPKLPILTTNDKAATKSRSSLFEDEPAMTKSTSSALFQDDDDSGMSSPWDMPTPRKQKRHTDVVRTLLPISGVPDAYVDLFDAVVRDDGGNGSRIAAGGVARTLAAARLSADDQARIMSLVAPGDDSSSIFLGREEFNVLLALIGLAQEGEHISLDTVDERRRNLPVPKLPGLLDRAPVLPDFSELAAKPPQNPVTPPKAPKQTSPRLTATLGKPSMDYPDDPWNTPDLHKNHDHPGEPHSNGVETISSPVINGSDPPNVSVADSYPTRTTSTFTTGPVAAAAEPIRQSSGSVSTGSGAAWSYFDGSGGGLNEPSPNDLGVGQFGRGVGGDGGSGGQEPGGNIPPSVPGRTIGSGRTGSAIEETIVVNLIPEKEGIFMFQHHNYEVSSMRRGSKVIRRYSDFVWLLDCLHKRYPFRVLPLLPPKRVAVNGNHLSNDGAFIEKRRRGLARFLNALVRHPVLSQEQLVVMFLTVPTELAVWRKQVSISVQDEFSGRTLPPGLEESLPASLNDLFERTRAGVRRSAELYINACNVMDRLVKRCVGVAADHGRLAMALAAMTEASADTYATDMNDVPLLNDGIQATSKHLRTGQTLMEDEARAWDEGVLEDLKRQRDALVSLRDLFDRRERLDRDNIPYLEKRIHTNETKLANLRAKPEGLVKPGEIDKVVEAIIKDKESIVTQHNRSVFVKECLRDELVYFQSTQYHITRWNQDWAQERVKYSEMLADNWRRLIDELEGMPTGD